MSKAVTFSNFITPNIVNGEIKQLKKSEYVLKEEKKDITILSLDLKHCFYCIHPDFSEIIKFLNEKIET